MIGHLPGDLRATTSAGENRRLRRRIADLEALVLALQEENDRLTAVQAAALLEHPDLRAPMQPV